jgi:hypothetical protein
MLKLGHDSEFGLSLDGTIVSALDHLAQEDYPEGSLFPDNMNCEIAITPCSELQEWQDKTEFLLDKVRDKGFDLVMTPTILYPDECMKNPLAYISGCNPDFSAYTGDEQNAPDFKKSNGLRSCGAHVHFSTELNPHRVCQWLDVLLGIPLLFKEKPSIRREMYGQAGSMRTKEYGGEYRALSNVWLEDAANRENVFNNTEYALFLATEMQVSDVVDVELVQSAINNHNLEQAHEVLSALWLRDINPEGI